MREFRIRQELHIDASMEEVFDALTDSDQIVKYFPLTEVVSEWTVGSKVLYKGDVGGTKFTDFGIIESLVRPSEYAYRYWSDNHGTENTAENQLTITYKLAAEGGGTKLTLTQDNLPSKELYELMKDVVWDSLLEGLKNHVESDTYAIKSNRIEEMTETHGLNHLGLTVANLDATTSFFVQALGWKEVARDESYPRTAVTDGKLRLTLWQVDHSLEVQEFNRRKNIGLHHLAIEVNSREDLHAVFHTVSEYSGVEIEFEPELLGEGPRMHMMCSEPGGIRIEIIWAGT